MNRSLAERPIAAQFVSIIYALWNENDMYAADRKLRTAASLSLPERKSRTGGDQRDAAWPVRHRRVR